MLAASEGEENLFFGICGPTQCNASDYNANIPTIRRLLPSLINQHVILDTFTLQFYDPTSKFKFD